MGEKRQKLLPPGSQPPAADSWGFRVWQGAPSVMARAHQHTDVEVNFILEGWMRYFLAGRFVTVPKGKLVAMWAGMPHRLAEMAPSTRCVWITIPLSWFLAWGLKDSFSSSLLAGDLMMEPKQTAAPADRRLHLQWVQDLESKQPERRAIAMLEVEARIRRLALAADVTPASSGRVSSLGPVDRIYAHVAAHYTEELSIGDVAEAVGLHPNYVMTVFKKSCGTTLRDYIARLRVWHAQRLLLTTDAKILEVMLESGFASASRFYDTFAKISGQSPRAYRALYRGK